MDPSVNPVPYTPLPPSKKPYVIISIIFICLLIVGGLFFYQKSITVNLKPKQPNKVVVIPTPTILPWPSPNQYQTGPFACPSIPEFCQNGKDVYSGNLYLGFGAPLPPQSPIFAAFDGEFTAIKTTMPIPNTNKVQNLILATLTNKEHLLRAAYHFVGPLPKNGIVKEGEVVATSSGELIPIYDNSALMFVLTRFDPVMGSRLDGERVHLTKQDFR